jgi:hypothetical protein
MDSQMEEESDAFAESKDPVHLLEDDKVRPVP